MGRLPWVFAGLVVVGIAASLWSSKDRELPPVPMHSSHVGIVANDTRDASPSVQITSQYYLPADPPAQNVSKDIVVVPVEGHVVDSHGYPVAGARVVPSGGHPVLTNADGFYRAALSLSVGAGQFLATFQATGYRETTLAWAVENRAGPLHTGDVALEPLGAPGELRGRLLDSRGWPVAGETVRLFSASLNHRLQAVSDAGGEFMFQRVFSATDYRAWVEPSGPWRDAGQSMLDLPGPDAWLELTLEPAGSAALRGRLVNASGAGVGPLEFQLESNTARGQVVTLAADDDGYFAAGAIPAGEFALRRRAEPFFSAEGFSADDGEILDLEVQVDLGDMALAGRVVDSWGKPVANADLTLRHGNAATRSLRSASTDNQGEFEFMGLDTGDRTLEVRATGYRPRSIDVYGQQGLVEVELQETQDIQAFLE